MSARSNKHDRENRRLEPGVSVPPGTPSWITAELIALTLKVWQKHYKEPLSLQDAVTILLNAEQLFGVLARE